MDISILLWLQEFRNGGGAFLAEFFTKMTFFGELNTVLIIMALIYLFPADVLYLIHFPLVSETHGKPVI